MKHKYSKFLILIILLIIFIFITAKSYANSISKNLSDNIFRLHIIANSDSNEDQNLKLKVRDNIILYLKDNIKNPNSKNEILSFISNNLDKLYKIAVNTIYENDYNYDISIELGNFYFPTKYYGNISMPAGYYDAIRIKIGKAKRPKLVV